MQTPRLRFARESLRGWRGIGMLRVLPEKWEPVMAKSCAKEPDKKHDKTES